MIEPNTGIFLGFWLVVMSLQIRDVQIYKKKCNSKQLNKKK